MRCRAIEFLLAGVLLAHCPGALAAAAGAHPSPTLPVAAVEGLPDVATAAGDRQAFAAFVAGCAAALAPRDRGLSRVARICHGVEVVLADGPFAKSLPEDWAGDVDAEMLGQLAALARSFDAAPSRSPALQRHALDAGLRELRHDVRAPVGLWERLAAWYEQLTRRREAESDPAWLREFLQRLGLSADEGFWIESTIYAIAVALVLALLIAEARAHGWWSRLRALATRRAEPPRHAASAATHPRTTDPVAELARRFGARLGELHAAGHVPRPLTITCRELALLAGAQRASPLAHVARVAPVVEAARYAPIPPPPDEIERALALLAMASDDAHRGAHT